MPLGLEDHLLLLVRTLASERGGTVKMMHRHVLFLTGGCSILAWEEAPQACLPSRNCLLVSGNIILSRFTIFVLMHLLVTCSVVIARC